MRIAALAFTALMLLAPAVACAQDLPAARAFVLRLYQAYHQDDDPDYLGPKAPQVFSPGLLALIRRDAAHTPKGDVGALDGDPICDCQDFDLSDIRVDVADRGPGRAQARVSFLNDGQPCTIRLDLVAVRGHWRVGDVRTEDTPSLVSYLKQNVK